MRAILARNVRDLMDLHYAQSSNRPKSLAKDAGLALSTIQRVIAGATGASLDNIEMIASAFDLSAYQLLIPSLSVDNPQVVQGATREEERMYRLWRKTGGEMPAKSSHDA